MFTYFWATVRQVLLLSVILTPKSYRVFWKQPGKQYLSPTVCIILDGKVTFFKHKNRYKIFLLIFLIFCHEMRMTETLHSLEKWTLIYIYEKCITPLWYIPLTPFSYQKNSSDFSKQSSPFKPFFRKAITNSNSKYIWTINYHAYLNKDWRHFKRFANVHEISFISKRQHFL